jgi:TolA-binding protein
MSNYIIGHRTQKLITSFFHQPDQSASKAEEDENDDSVVDILRSYPGNWPIDITDLVFLAIENDPNWRKRYETYADGDYGTANSQFGAFIRDYTGLTAVGINNNPKSKLIKSYSFLANIGKK